MIDQMVSELVGQTRPIVDQAIDMAAIVALNKAVDLAENLQASYPGIPIPDDLGSPTAAYLAGWEDALSALMLAVRGVRNRIQASATQAADHADAAPC